MHAPARNVYRAASLNREFSVANDLFASALAASGSAQPHFDGTVHFPGDYARGKVSLADDGASIRVDRNGDIFIINAILRKDVRATEVIRMARLKRLLVARDTGA
jgi:hypothetical protein